MTPDLKHSAAWQSLRDKIFAAPWHEWAHAYGPADDVPPLLESLAVGSPQERESAGVALYGDVYHQGTRWHASPRAVPFLLDLLALPIADRPWLLDYLMALALGYEEQFLPRGIDPEVEFANAEDQDDDQSCYDEEQFQSAEFVRYGVFARDCYLEAERGCDLFLSLLDDPDLATRLASVHALAWFPRRAQDISRVLLKRWDDMDEAEQANALLAMSLLAPRLPYSERARWVARADATLDLGGAVGKFAAAIAMANWSASAGEPWPRRALQVLAGCIAGGDLERWQQEHQEATGASLGWHSGDLAAMAIRRLADAPDEERARAAAALIEALPESEARLASKISNALLVLIFAPDGDGEIMPAKRGSLSHDQKSALAAIAQHGAWSESSGFSTDNANLLRAFGLPTSRDELRS